MPAEPCPASSRGATAGSTSPLDPAAIRRSIWNIFTIDDAGTATTLHGLRRLPLWRRPRTGRLDSSSRRAFVWHDTLRRHVGSDGILYSIDLAGNYSVLHSFSSTTDGGQPDTDLVEASDGNFYGVTDILGKVFRVDPTGTVTPLHALPGSSPRDLIQGADGRCTGRRHPVAPMVVAPSSPSTCNDDARHASRIRKGRARWRPEWRHPGSQRPILWDNKGGGRWSPPGAHRDSVRDGWHGRAYRPCTRSDFLSGLTSSSMAHRCRTCSKAPTEACTEPRLTCSSKLSFRRDNLQNQPCRRLHEGTGNYFLRAGVIQARDGRLYGIRSDGVTICNPICRIDFGSVFRVEGNGTLTVLHRFDADSASPVAELVEIDDGSL